MTLPFTEQPSRESESEITSNKQGNRQGKKSQRQKKPSAAQQKRLKELEKRQQKTKSVRSKNALESTPMSVNETTFRELTPPPEGNNLSASSILNIIILKVRYCRHHRLFIDVTIQ